MATHQMDAKWCGTHLVNQRISYRAVIRMVVCDFLFDFQMYSKNNQTCSCTNTGNHLCVDWTGWLRGIIWWWGRNITGVYNDNIGYDCVYIWTKRYITANRVRCVFGTGFNKSTLCYDGRISIVFRGDIRIGLAVDGIKTTITTQQDIKIHLCGIFNRINRHVIHRTFCYCPF